MSVALPIEMVVHHHAFRRAEDAIVGGEEFAGQGLGPGVDESGGTVEAVALVGIKRAVGLQVIELPRPQTGHKQTPHMAPAAQFVIKQNDILGVAVCDLIV